MKKSFLVVSLLIAVFTLNSCASVGIMRETYTSPQVLPQEVLCPPQNELEWEQLTPGFEVTQYKIPSYKVEWACVKIDLNTPGLTIAATPHTEDLGKRSKLSKTDFHLQTTASASTTVAINTTPFDLDGRTYLPVSVVKIAGEEICPPNASYCALCLGSSTEEINSTTQTATSPLRATILESQNLDLISKYPYAFGGFYQILHENQIKEFAKYKRSRTACGTADSGRYLYLFATCGINCPTGRNGLNFEECAVILQFLGCDEAMEFDGGHSTGLTINGKNKIRPSLQRKVPAAVMILKNTK